MKRSNYFSDPNRKVPMIYRTLRGTRTRWSVACEFPDKNLTGVKTIEQLEQISINRLEATTFAERLTTKHNNELYEKMIQASNEAILRTLL